MSTNGASESESRNQQLATETRKRLAWRPASLHAGDSFLSEKADQNAPFLDRARRSVSLYRQLQRRVQPWFGWPPLALEFWVNDVPFLAHSIEQSVAEHSSFSPRLGSEWKREGRTGVVAGSASGKAATHAKTRRGMIQRFAASGAASMPTPQPQARSPLSRPRVALATLTPILTTSPTKQASQSGSRAAEQTETVLPGSAWHPFFSAENEKPVSGDGPQSVAVPMASGGHLRWSQSAISNPPEAGSPGRPYETTVWYRELKPRATSSSRREVRGGFPALQSPRAMQPEPGKPGEESATLLSPQREEAYAPIGRRYAVPATPSSFLARDTENNADEPPVFAQRMEALEGQSPSQSQQPFGLRDSTPESEGAIESLIRRTVMPTPLPGLELRLLPPERQPGATSHQSSAQDRPTTTDGSIASTFPSGPPAPAQPNINEIADRVYQTLMRRHQLERERKGLY